MFFNLITIKYALLWFLPLQCTDLIDNVHMETLSSTWITLREDFVHLKPFLSSEQLRLTV